MKIARIILFQWLLILSIAIHPVVKADTFALNIYKEDGKGCNMNSNDFITTAMKKGWLFAGYMFQYMIDDNYKMNYTVGSERSKSADQLSVYASNIASSSETKYQGQDELFGVSECDISICYLSNIFGKMPGLLGTTEGLVCPNTVGSVGPEIVKSMFSYFNVGMMSVLYVFIAFYVFNAVLVGGYEGSITDKQLSLIAATRMCISAICMIPTSSGYTYLQIIIMYVLLNGIGFADRAFSNALYVFDQQLNQQLMGINSEQINRSTGVVTDSGGNVVSDSDKQYAAYQEYYNKSFLDALRIYSCSYYKSLAATIPKSGNYDMPAQPSLINPDPSCGSIAVTDPATLNMLRNVSYNFLYSAYTYYYQKTQGLNAIGGGSQENKTATSLDAYSTCLLCKNVQGYSDQYYVAAGQLQVTTSQLGGAVDVAKCSQDAATNYNGLLPKRENYIGDKLADSNPTNENNVIDDEIEKVQWNFCRNNNPGKLAGNTYSGCLMNMANYINAQVESGNLVRYNSSLGDYEAPYKFTTSNVKDSNSGGQVSITNECSPNYFEGYSENALRSRLAMVQAYRTSVREMFQSASYKSKFYKLLRDYNTPVDDTPTSSTTTSTTTSSQGNTSTEVIKVSNIDNVIRRVVKPFYSDEGKHPYFEVEDRGFYSTGAILNPALMNLQTTVLMIAQGMLGIELIDHKSYANYPESHACMWNIYANYCKNNSGRCYTELKNNNCIMQGRGLIGAYDAIKSNVTYNPFKDFVSLGMTIMQATGLYLIYTNIELFKSTAIISVQKHLAVIPVTIAGKLVQDALKHGIAKGLMLPPALSQVANQTGQVIVQVINLLADFDYAYMQNFTTIASAFSLLTFPMGMLMAILIPFYPVMIYTVAALGYFVSVVEIMVGAPVLALGLAYPQGHDIFGRSTTGFVNIFVVFLRPILMVISVILAMQLMVVALTLVNYGYINQLDVVFRNLYTSNGIEMIFIIWGFIFVYMYAIWELVSKSCTLMVTIGNKAMSYVASNASDDTANRAMGVISAVKGGVQSAGSKLSSSMGSLTGSATMALSKKLDSQFEQGFKSGFRQITTEAHKRAKNTALTYIKTMESLKDDFEKAFKTKGAQMGEELKNMTPEQRKAFVEAQKVKEQGLSEDAEKLMKEVIEDKKNGDTAKENLDNEISRDTPDLEKAKSDLNSSDLDKLYKKLDEKYPDGGWKNDPDKAKMFKYMGLSNDDIKELLLKGYQGTEEQKLTSLSNDQGAVNILHKAHQIPDQQFRFTTMVNMHAHSPKPETSYFNLGSRGADNQAALNAARNDIFIADFQKELEAKNFMAADFNKGVEQLTTFKNYYDTDRNVAANVASFGANFISNTATLLGKPLLGVATGDDSMVEADRTNEIKQFRNEVFQEDVVEQNMRNFQESLYTNNMGEAAKESIRNNTLENILRRQQSDMYGPDPRDGFNRAFNYQEMKNSGYTMEEIIRVNDGLDDNKIKPEDMISLRGPTVDELLNIPNMQLSREQIIDSLLAEKVSSVGGSFGLPANVNMLSRYDMRDLKNLGIRDDEISDARARRISNARGLFDSRFNRSPDDQGTGSAGDPL